MLPLLLCLCRSFGIGWAKAGGEDEYAWESGVNNWYNRKGLT